MSQKIFSRSVVLTCLALLTSTGLAFAQSAFDDPGARTSSGAAGDLKSVNEKTTGAVGLGSSTQVVVLFKNEDSKPIKVGGVNLYPSSNVTAVMGENQCADSPILPGEICATTISVKGLQPGNYRIEMLVRHDGRSKLLTSTIEGTVESSGDENAELMGDIEVKPSDIDFGTLTQSRIQLRPVVLRNVTSKPIKVNDVTINAGENSGFTVNADCGELATGAACIATVKWVPQQRGPSSAMVVVNHDGPTRISTVSLKGEYNPADSTAAQLFPEAVPGRGLLVSSKEEVDFGEVEQKASITLSLVNSGDSPLKINDITTSGNKNGLSVEKRGCIDGTELKPVEACALTLTVDPARGAGNIVDDVQIKHDGARGILVIPVRGTTNGGGTGGGDMMSGDQFLGSVAPLSVNDLVDGEDGSSSAGAGMGQQRAFALRDALSGYGITSFSKDRAILTKDGIGKIVYDQANTNINGLLMTVYIRKNVIEFHYEGEKAFLYFDGSFGNLDVSAISPSPSGGSAASTMTRNLPETADAMTSSPAALEEEESSESTALTILPTGGSTVDEPQEPEED